MRTRIVSIQGVLPEHRYTQADLTQAFTHGMTAQHVGAEPLPHALSSSSVRDPSPRAVPETTHYTSERSCQFAQVLRTSRPSSSVDRAAAS